MSESQTSQSLGAQSSGFRTLAELPAGGRGVIQRILGDSNLKRRLSALGIVRGTEIRVERSAPLGDPRVYSFLNYQLSLRNEEAHLIALSVEG